MVIPHFTPILHRKSIVKPRNICRYGMVMAGQSKYENNHYFLGHLGLHYFNQPHKKSFINENNNKIIDVFKLQHHTP